MQNQNVWGLHERLKLQMTNLEHRLGSNILRGVLDRMHHIKNYSLTFALHIRREDEGDRAKVLLD